MNTVKKGNQLENDFYRFLLSQKERGQLIYGAFAPELCQIYQKKKYYCAVRENDIECDVVIEQHRDGAQEPIFRLVFECKNYGLNHIPESVVTDFSSKLERIGRHNTKGILVVSSRLQSGAQNMVEKYGMGLIKYSKHGFETILERKGKLIANPQFLEKQIFENNKEIKSKKFSAYYNKQYTGSINEFISSIINSNERNPFSSNKKVKAGIKYLSNDEIESLASNLLSKAKYQSGAVDLKQICSYLSIELNFLNENLIDGDNKEILGTANFREKIINVFQHNNQNRKRYTIAHEIGHFYLKHEEFLESDTVIENDLIDNEAQNNEHGYDRLEFQANKFAAYLLLPLKSFLNKTEGLKNRIGMINRGHGYIFVDDQPCNLSDYHRLLSELSLHFGASKQAIEIRLKELSLLNDTRTR